MTGVWRTRVGYAGGTTERPTYRSMGDHTECFEVDFDPTVVTYEDLLELFWQSHDPTQPARKTQYASLVLTHGQAQAADARESAELVERLFGTVLSTRIEPVGTFWMAEDYHQKYYLRNDRLLFSEFRAAYPDDAGFVASTAAARVNGHLYGGTCSRLDHDLPGLGLSDEAAKHLRQHCR